MTDRLVTLGLATSRDEAARLVLAGLVLDGTRRIDKAGESVAADAMLTVRSRGRFVSRGGDKLESTSCPIAFSVTEAMNSLTTPKLTSASSNAVRTSPMAS